jgi:hypothetical protein
MIREFFEHLRKPNPLATIVWDCDPLVILNSDDQVMFADKAQVEFTPESIRGDRGAARTNGYSVAVEQRIDRPVSIDVHIRSRGGFTLIGTDPNGNPVTWLIGKAADDFLRAPRL